MNNIKTPVFEDVSDDFFELTVSDAKLLYKEAKKYCAELEEAPLMTAAQREFEHDKKVLSLLNQHKKTVLRIKFPDMTVLQGTFSPLEPISAVEKFVADYLENPKLEFYLCKFKNLLIYINKILKWLKKLFFCRYNSAKENFKI